MLNKVILAVLLMTASVAMASGEQEAAPSQILINNVKIFNGKDNELTPGSVLVENNLIKAIGGNISTNSDATVFFDTAIC